MPARIFAVLALLLSTPALAGPIYMVCDSSECADKWDTRLKQAQCQVTGVRCAPVKGPGNRRGCTYSTANCMLATNAQCPPDHTKATLNFYGSICRYIGKAAASAPPLPVRGLPHICLKALANQNTAGDCWRRAQAEFKAIGCRVTGGGCESQGSNWFCRVQASNCDYTRVGGGCGYQKNVVEKATSHRAFCVKK